MLGWVGWSLKICGFCLEHIPNEVMKKKILGVYRHSRVLRSVLLKWAGFCVKKALVRNKILEMTEGFEMPFVDLAPLQAWLSIATSKYKSDRLAYTAIADLCSVGVQNCTMFCKGQLAPGSDLYVTVGLKILEGVNSGWQREVIRNQEEDDDPNSEYSGILHDWEINIGNDEGQDFDVDDLDL